jgi:hypothetical protein
MSAVYGQVRVYENASDVKSMVRLVAQQIDKSVRDPWTRAYASEIVRGSRQFVAPGGPSEVDQIKRVYWHVKNNILYIQDPRGYEWVATAKRTVQSGSGDCDDSVVLVASLLSVLGFATGARVISTDGNNWHIYTLVGFDPHYQPTKFIALDTTQREAYPGWEPPPALRTRQIDVGFHGGKAYTTQGREI